MHPFKAVFHGWTYLSDIDLYINTVTSTLSYLFLERVFIPELMLLTCTAVFCPHCNGHSTHGWTDDTLTSLTYDNVSEKQDTFVCFIVLIRGLLNLFLFFSDACFSLSLWSFNRSTNWNLKFNRWLVLCENNDMTVLWKCLQVVILGSPVLTPIYRRWSAAVDLAANSLHNRTGITKIDTKTFTLFSGLVCLLYLLYTCFCNKKKKHTLVEVKLLLCDNVLTSSAPRPDWASPGDTSVPLCHCSLERFWSCWTQGTES